MSKRKSRPTQSSRGPSRPVNQRYYSSRRVAPSRRPDTFLIWLIGISTALVVVLVFFLTTANRGVTTGTQTSTTIELPTAAGGAIPTPNGPQWTATAIAFATDTAPLPRISAEELKTLWAANNVKLVDVRLKTLYDKQHIKGATSVPQSEYLAKIKEFPKEGNLVLYCQ